MHRKHRRGEKRRDRMRGQLAHDAEDQQHARDVKCEIRRVIHDGIQSAQRVVNRKRQVHERAVHAEQRLGEPRPHVRGRERANRVVLRHVHGIVPVEQTCSGRSSRTHDGEDNDTPSQAEVDGRR